jgi:hypothetical protein
MNWKDYGRERSLLYLGYCDDICLDVLRKFTKYFSQSSGQDSHPGPQVWCRELSSRLRPLVLPRKCHDVYMLKTKKTSVSITSTAKEIRPQSHTFYHYAYYSSSCCRKNNSSSLYFCLPSSFVFGFECSKEWNTMPAIYRDLYQCLENCPAIVT